MRGSAVQGTMRGGANDPRLSVQFADDGDQGVRQQLVQDAVIASAVHGLLRLPLASRFSLVHNGRVLPMDQLPGLDPAVPPPQAAWFEGAVPVEGDWSGLIRRGGPSPRAAHTVTLAGGSLSPEQDRLLHVRGICEPDEGGLLQVEQLLFNPHGSVFHFTCDTALSAAGRPRAPDPLSYAAAGIAFCFMTQVGRYASILKLPVEDCALVQDLHFSPGGATGGTGQPGSAQPVETHLQLTTRGDDADALRILRMAEQTCFLHALAKQQLRARVALLDWSDAAPPPQA
jgi:uncharacterized OsmC-like protein